MTEEFVNLRSRKNPKARIKLMGGHFATMNSHVNTYIDMSTVKTRHNKQERRQLHWQKSTKPVLW